MPARGYGAGWGVVVAGPPKSFGQGHVLLVSKMNFRDEGITPENF
jgi:hypothetical protein